MIYYTCIFGKCEFNVKTNRVIEKGAHFRVGQHVYLVKEKSGPNTLTVIGDQPPPLKTVIAAELVVS